MPARVRCLRARGGRGEQGFALLATLVIVGVASVLILAMLGLSLSASKFSEAQVQRDARTRAADSAIDAAINVLVRETDTIGRVGAQDPCVLAEENADGLPAMVLEGQEVVVTCTPQASDAPPAPLDGEPAFEQVKVVGTDYAGAVDPAAGDVLDALAPLGGAAATAADTYASSGATIVHSAPGPLVFSSDVTVRRGTAAFRSPANSGGRTFGPALAASGVYSQGDSGLSDADQPNTRDCGAQSRWNEPATKAVWMRTIRIEPACAAAAPVQNGETTWAQWSGRSGEARPFTWGPNALLTPRTLPAGCPGGRVVVLLPGAYGPTQTAQLNQWFSQGNCDSKTFLFRSGDYLFDVGGTGVLRMNDPTSNIVFGDPDEWSPESSPTVDQVAEFFPQACALNDEGIDGRNTGVTLTLTSRTVIRHERGRVAICDQRTSNDPVTAVWQPAVLTPEWGPVSPAVTPAASSPATNDGERPRRRTFSSLSGITTPGDGSAATTDTWCDNGFIGLGLLRDCEKSTASIVVPAWNQPIPAVPSPIDSLEFVLTGSTKNMNAGQLDVRLRNASSAVVCQSSFSLGLPTSFNTQPLNRTVQLLDEARGDCGSKIDDLRDLIGVTVEFQFTYSPNCPGPFGRGWLRCTPSQIPALSVDGLTLRGYSTLTEEGVATSPWLVTSDVRDTPVDSTSFNVFGRVSVPNVDVDVRWNGAATSDPIFGGTLVVNGLGSSGPSTVTAGGAFVSTPGIVCCVRADPSERVVVINAWTDVQEKAGGGFEGRLSATARVAVEDYLIGVSGQPQYSPGNRVRVETWQLCDSPIADFPGVTPDPTLAAPTCRTV